MSDQKTILVSACGSSIGLEVLRCLKLANRTERIIGTEVSPWGKQVARAYCDEVHLIPRGDDPGYPSVIRSLFEAERVSLALINTEPELSALYDVRDQITTPLSCPTQHGLRACLSKQVLHDRLQSAAITAGTMVVDGPEDLQRALEQFGSPVWLRCAVGPRGRGSIVISTAEQGIFWMEYWRSRDAGDDVWLAHEYLPGRNLNWTSVWKEGELIAAATGERLKYFMEQVAISGVTGNVSHCQLIDGSQIHETAIQAVELAAPRPHGIYAVDLRENHEGQAMVTEINARNAFRPLLFAQGQVNFPAIMIDSFLYDQSNADVTTGSAQVGLEMVRGMDFPPLFRESAQAEWRSV